VCVRAHIAPPCPLQCKILAYCSMKKLPNVQISILDQFAKFATATAGYILCSYLTCCPSAQALLLP
jgi:hypothetical protein